MVTFGPLRLRTSAMIVTCAAFLLWSSFPELAWWWFTPAAVGLFTFAVQSVAPRHAAWLGAWFGGCFMAAHVTWAYVLGGVAPWLGLVATQVPFYALVGYATARIYQAKWPAKLAAVCTVGGVAGMWVVAEWLKSRVPFGGFGWGRLVFAQPDAPPVWWARVGGASLVSCAVVVTSLALMHALLSRKRRRSVVWCVVAVVVYCAPAALASGALPTVGSLAVAGVQGNAPSLGLGYNRPYKALRDLHIAELEGFATEVSEGGRPRPDLVVLPENGIDVAPLQDQETYDMIQRVVDKLGAPVFVGAVTFDDAGAPKNSTLNWVPGAGPVQVYDKRFLVPFGEYIPLRSVFEKVNSLVRQVTTNFVPGHAPGVLSIDVGDDVRRVGVTTCVEVSSDAMVADVVRGGAQIIVVPSNTAQFGYTAQSGQQLAMSRVRAIEHGRSVVQVATVGRSGLITPRGELMAVSEVGTSATLQSSLPLVDKITMSSTFRVSLEAVLALMGLLALIATFWCRCTGNRPRRPLQ